MNRKLAQVPLLAFALALSGNGIAGERAPAASESARADAKAAHAQAETARTEAETARHELEGMRMQMRELSRKMGEVSAKLGDVGPHAYAYRYLGNPDRGMIGVVFSYDDSTGTKGLRVDAVTPGGPAEKAGIRHGDVIVAVDGKAVENDNKIERLSQFHELKIGQKMSLSILRDGDKSQIAVKAERREPYNFGEAFGSMDAADMHELAELDNNPQLPPEFQQHVHEQVERAMSQTHVAQRAGETARNAVEHLSISTPWWGLNLVSLNPDLGSYFGADKGVLVISANDSLKGLKSGDVLLGVAGQKVERPEDALRLLREHPSGSNVKVQVLRQRKPLSLSMQPPEFKGIFVPPPPPPPPLPPVPPTPPTPPAPPAPSAHSLLPALPAPPAPPVPPTPQNEDSNDN